MTAGRRWTLAMVVFGTTLGAPGAAAAQMRCDPCTVGVVMDGPWERNDEVRGIFEGEVLDLVGDDFDVRFPEDKRHLADWSLAGVASAVDGLMSDPEVDLILTMGPVASTYAARLQTFPKPLVAVFVIDPEVQGIPTATNDQGDRVSGVTNLNYVTFPSDIEQSVRRLREITPFRRLTLLTSEGLVEAVPELEANLLGPVEGLDVELSTARVGTSVEAAIAAIPEDADAVYVYPLIQLPPGDFDRLVQALIERRLPSFWVYPGFPTIFSGLLGFFVGDFMGKALWQLVENAQRFPRRGGRVLCVHGAVSFHGARPWATRWLPGRGARRDVELDRCVLGLRSGRCSHQNRRPVQAERSIYPGKTEISGTYALWETRI